MYKKKLQVPKLHGLMAPVDVGLTKRGEYLDIATVPLTNDGYKMVEAYKAAKASMSATGKFKMQDSRTDTVLFNRAALQAKAAGAPFMSWVNAQINMDRKLLFPTMLGGAGATVRYIRYLGKDPSDFPIPDDGMLDEHTRDKLLGRETRSDVNANPTVDPNDVIALRSAINALKSTMVIRNKTLDIKSNLNVLAGPFIGARHACACLMIAVDDPEVFAANKEAAKKQLQTTRGLEAAMLSIGYPAEKLRELWS